MTALLILLFRIVETRSCDGLEILQIQFKYQAMNIDEKERLARFRDISNEAISTRLRAAWRAAGYATQKDFSVAIGISHTTYNTQEIKGRPALPVLHFLYRNHRIDYNFILYGDFLQLPVAVQDALFEVLRAGGSASVRAPN